MFIKWETTFYHDIIESIIAALEARDNYTAYHSRRVADMVQAMCRILNLGPGESERIHMAAHVHDIGKIGVPDRILCSGGKLTGEDWEIMKKHPVIGAEILSKAESLGPVKDMVLHHHERWDGGGYPDGLAGREIPFGSRIIALCDSVDAMLSERAYREPMATEECLIELGKNRGKMFDPELTDIMVLNWNELIRQRAKANPKG